jgi:hypothetical protein
MATLSTSFALEQLLHPLGPEPPAIRRRLALGAVEVDHKVRNLGLMVVGKVDWVQ